MAKSGNKCAVTKMNENILKMLEQYNGDIQGNLTEIVKGFGQKGVQALKSNSRAKLGGSGEYARGWKYTLDDNRISPKVTLHNKNYRLPHLLEHGHVTRNGTGRTYGRTPAHEHIAEVEQELIQQFETEVKSKL